MILHFLAYMVDPLPAFVSQPSAITLHMTKVAILYCAYRFLILHRQWRFNFLLSHVCYAVLSLTLWCVYPIDPWLALFTACLWCFPTMIVMTVLLHELLGDNAWKTHDTLEYSYITEDLCRDMESKMRSSKPSSPTWSSTSYQSQFVGRGRTCTLLDEEDSDGEHETNEGAFTRVINLNMSVGARRQRIRTPCSTPVLS